MSMSTYCCYEECIDESVIVKLCPVEHAAFLATLTEECDIEAFADLLFNHADEGISEEAGKAFDELKDAFDKKTGLFLGMAYFSAQERSDELDGYTFTVGNVYVPSEAAKPYLSDISRKHWTSFG